MKEMFDEGSDSPIMVKNFTMNPPLENEKDYDENQVYTYDVYFRHHEGVDINEEIKKFL